MRALARWGITPLLAAPLGAWALGLGDIELQSALNQPFRAQIALASATPDELQGLRVALASADTFFRYGLERPEFLSALQFRVVTQRDGRGIVQVTSREAIAEPFVTLLVEATWPRGRLLREYTVLLDPPVLLPAPTVPPVLQPAETRPPAVDVPGGPISRPAPQPAAPSPAPAPRAQPPQSPVSSSPPPAAAPRVPASAPSGTYGPVQRAETLWAIADRFRPEGVTINQMMIAVYRANPQAFGGNINLLRAGTSLRLPEAADFDTLAATVANSEVQRQTDEWLNRASPGLRLLPPVEAEVARAPAPAPTVPAPAPTPAPSAAPSPSTDAAAAAAVAESRRLIELRNQELQNIQQQASAVDEEPPAAAPVAGNEPAAGVDLESEQLFADESPAPEPVEAEASAPTPAPVPLAPVASGPSLVSQILGWALSPLLWIGLGVAALLLTALWFVRRRRQEPEDVTGRWEALQSEVDDEAVREATARMRRQIPEEPIVVEEQQPERSRPSQSEPHEPTRRPASARPARAERAAAPAATSGDETLSSQTVINLDQADAVAEADFHMAYGLYDQAAELVQKALEAAPDRRDLKLKLLEVFFVWGNKDAFLKAAQGLRRELGDGADQDWDKVVIMGRQICPDERLFTEATTGPGRVDVDLEAGDSPLDLAFDDASAADAAGDLAASLDFDLEASAIRAPVKAGVKSAAKAPRDAGEDLLDIGSRTAAGLEAALFAPGQDDDEVTGNRTTPDLAADTLAVTQESPTIERPQVTGRDWAAVDSPTMRYAADAPTVETPTIESPAAGSRTTETRTVQTPFRGSEPPTIEQPGLATGSGDYTAEIDLDDLGLDVKDLEGLPTDLGDLPMAAGRDTDTREQPALNVDHDLLSATGVTQVLSDSGDDDDELEQRKTSVLADQDATMLAPGFDDGTLTGTAVLPNRMAVDESGDTSLVKQLRKDEGLDLDLADLTQALHGADTVEQPRASSFSRDVFEGGDTPLDMDIGSDASGSDDPTGTEEVSPLDPQTMTEVGTKLDLARAYIDMGDPEGARSILEEVLDEGDPNQRREAQSLIDVLSA